MREYTMKKKFKYVSFSAYERRKKIVCIALVICLATTIPLSLLISNIVGYSATFNVAYLNPDADFTLDYSNIEYIIDGVTGTLGTTGIVSFAFNDQLVHRLIESLLIAQNFTILFGGERYQFLFSENIAESVSLDTKSLSSTIYFEDLGVIVDSMVVDLMWFDGTSWILIESGTTSNVGLIQFSNLISGEYKIVEAGDDDGENSFYILNSDIVYFADAYVIPDLTIVNFEYENSVFGPDYTLDVSAINWKLAYYNGATWSWTDYPLEYCMSYSVIDGTIVFSELEYSAEGYMIWTSYNIDGFKPITLDGETTIDYTAKSGKFEFLWSEDSEPVQNTGMELFYYDIDSSSWLSAGVYITNSSGIIYLAEMLPFGMDFKWLEHTPFNIAVDDEITYTATYVVDSITMRDVFTPILLLGMMAKFFFFSIFS